VLTASGHGLVGTEKQRNCVKCTGLARKGLLVQSSFERESSQNSRTLLGPVCGNTSDCPDASTSFQESYLFFLTGARSVE
jgi:hypothetical protein